MGVSWWSKLVTLPGASGITGSNLVEGVGEFVRRSSFWSENKAGLNLFIYHILLANNTKTNKTDPD